MSASKVYYTNLRTTFQENLLQKLARLVKKAGMLEEIDFKNKYMRHDIGKAIDEA